jgi:predicted DNA-binding transcriptional regulator AlpA
VSDASNISRDLITALADALREANREGLDAGAAATLIGVSRSKFYQLDRRGMVPAQVTIGAGEKNVWLASELHAWLRAGAPTRKVWQQIRQQALRAG